MAFEILGVQTSSSLFCGTILIVQVRIPASEYKILVGEKEKTGRKKGGIVQNPMRRQISTLSMDRIGFFKDNSKSHDADMQSSDGAVKSDISVEIISGCLGSSKRAHPGMNVAEDGLNTAMLDTQQRTESSCSSSLPVTFSNHSFQTNSVGPTDSSNSKTASSESGVSAQIARKAVINARAKNCMKISLVNEEISQGDGEVVAGFDLNEDISANEMDDYIQPVSETNETSSRVIHVLAKTGIPEGQPKIPLKFEGSLGWRGSSGTSAFRPANTKTCMSNERGKEPTGFTGIDLNIAAVEDNADPQDSCFEVPSSKRAKNPSFDLNCLYNGDDEFSQQPESRNPSSADFNKKIPDSAKPRKPDFEFTRQDYLAHLSMQNTGNTNILQPAEVMQRVVTLQPNFPFMPSHNYPSTGQFHLPYSRYSQEYNTVNAMFGAPYLVQKHNGPKMEDQEAWHAASVKRKEPEGGLEFYQLGYKQMT